MNIPYIPDDFQIDDISDTIDSITYNCSIPKLPCRITESLNGILVNACDTHMHVVVPKTRDTEMKYFFKDYKNYYYLPMEHMAIHKSMAAYVDDAHKEKATKDNAFTHTAILHLSGMASYWMTGARMKAIAIFTREHLSMRMCLRRNGMHRIISM